MDWPTEDEIARQMASDGQHCVRHEVLDDFWDGWWTTGFTMFVRKV